MNEKKEFLNEEEYQRNNQKLKKVGKAFLIVGIIILVIGFILIVSGFLGFGSNVFGAINEGINGTDVSAKSVTGAFGGAGIIAIGGFVNSAGFTLSLIGGIILIISHRREIKAYTMQQVMPVAQEGIEKMTPTIADAAGSIAKSVSKGITEGKEEAKNNEK